MSDQKIIDTIAEALDAMPADARPVELVNRDRAAKALAALRANNIAVVELPEPDGHGNWWDTDQSDGWSVWITKSGRYVNVNPGRAITKSASTAHSFASALLAAANRAERAE